MRAAASLVLAVLLAASPAVGREITVPPTSFAPTSGGTMYTVDQGGLGCLRLNKGSTFFVAAVPAAPGEAIEELTLLVEDFNPDGLAMLTLARRRPAAFDVVDMSLPSAGTGALEALALRPAAPVPVSPNETYLLQVLLSGPEVCLHGVRVRLGESGR
jgi:hypothetical protein